MYTPLSPNTTCAVLTIIVTLSLSLILIRLLIRLLTRAERRGRCARVLAAQGSGRLRRSRGSGPGSEREVDRRVQERDKGRSGGDRCREQGTGLCEHSGAPSPPPPSLSLSLSISSQC